MALETMSTLNGILKDFYIGPIRTQFNAEIPLYNRVRRDRESIVGRQAIFPVHLKWSESVGAIAEDGTIPTGGNEDVVQAIVPIRTLWGRVEITTKVIEATKSDAGAFTQALEFKLTQVTNNLKKELETQLQGDGTGALAKITQALSAANDNFYVDNPGTLRPGMVLKAASARTGGTARTSPSYLTVRSVDYVTGEVKTVEDITGTPDWAVNDFVFRGDPSAGFVGRGLNIMGLLGIVDDGTYVSTLFSISRATYPLWKAVVLANAGTPRGLSLELLQAAEDQVWTVSGARPTAIYSHLAQRQAYVQILLADRRFVNVMKFDGGVNFDALEYNGRPWFVSRECPKDVVYLIDEDSLRFFMLKDIGWMEQDGAILHRKENSLAYTATLEMHTEFGCYYPNHNAVIRDLVVPSGY
ncbi:MAG: phage major capsid protein [Candidatus Caldarchaeum sp.]